MLGGVWLSLSLKVSPESDIRLEVVLVIEEIRRGDTHGEIDGETPGEERRTITRHLKRDGERTGFRAHPRTGRYAKKSGSGQAAPASRETSSAASISSKRTERTGHHNWERTENGRRRRRRRLLRFQIRCCTTEPRSFPRDHPPP